MIIPQIVGDDHQLTDLFTDRPGDATRSGIRIVLEVPNRTL